MAQTPEGVSREFAEVINLCKAIVCHKKTCDDSACGVSLNVLMGLATRLGAENVSGSERKQMVKILTETLPFAR
jgi:hypothetical protein